MDSATIALGRPTNWLAAADLCAPPARKGPNRQPRERRPLPYLNLRPHRRLSPLLLGQRDPRPLDPPASRGPTSPTSSARQLLFLFPRHSVSSSGRSSSSVFVALSRPARAPPQIVRLSRAWNRLTWRSLVCGASKASSAAQCSRPRPDLSTAPRRIP